MASGCSLAGRNMADLPLHVSLEEVIDCGACGIPVCTKWPSPPNCPCHGKGIMDGTRHGTRDSPEGHNEDEDHDNGLHEAIGTKFVLLRGMTAVTTAATQPAVFVQTLSPLTASVVTMFAPRVTDTETDRVSQEVVIGTKYRPGVAGDGTCTRDTGT